MAFLNESLGKFLLLPFSFSFSSSCSCSCSCSCSSFLLQPFLLFSSLVRMGTFLLDYGAGNVLSVINAIKAQGVTPTIISSPDQLPQATKLIFPGVGSFGACVAALESRGFLQPLRDYIASGKPLLGICLGMQLLFEDSEESPGVKGLGVIPGSIRRLPWHPTFPPPPQKSFKLWTGWIESVFGKGAVT